MNLTRLIVPDLDTTSIVDRLLNETELDFMQIDCMQPEDNRRENVGVNWRTNCSAEFLKHLRTIHRSMFLRPQLRVVTDAGGGDVIGFMEELAASLLEHGSAELPIAAIRCEILPPEIDELLPSDESLTGDRVMSARVELGAEPLQLALHEGARIVVASAYDSAAPFIAAAMDAGLCGWEDKGQLANLAAASQFEGVLAEVRNDGSVESEQAALKQLDQVRQLMTVEHADLKCDYSHILLEPTGRRTQIIKNAFGFTSLGTWKVRVEVSQGYQASMLIKTSMDGARRIHEFCKTDVPGNTPTVSEYSPTEHPDTSRARILVIEYRDDSSERCQAFVDSLQFWIRRNSEMSVTAPFPSIHQITKEFCTRVPTDQVVISVDTRPAREWL